jgi:hypothetical protein
VHWNENVPVPSCNAMVCVCACDALANGATREDQPDVNVYLSGYLWWQGRESPDSATRCRELLPERIACRRC